MRPGLGKTCAIGASLSSLPAFAGGSPYAHSTHPASWVFVLCTIALLLLTAWFARRSRAAGGLLALSSGVWLPSVLPSLQLLGGLSLALGLVAVATATPTNQEHPPGRGWGPVAIPVVLTGVFVLGLVGLGAHTAPGRDPVLAQVAHISLDHAQVAPAQIQDALDDLGLGDSRAEELDGRPILSMPLVHPSVVPALEDTLWAVDRGAVLDVPGASEQGRLHREVTALGERFAVWGLIGFLWSALWRRPSQLSALAAAGTVVAGATGMSIWMHLVWTPHSTALLLQLALLCAVLSQVPGLRIGPASGSAIAILLGFIGLSGAGAPLLVSLVTGALLGAVLIHRVLPSIQDQQWPGPRARRVITVLAFCFTLGLTADVGLILFGVFTPPPIAQLPTGTLEEIGNERRFGSARLARTEGIWVLRSEGDPVRAGYSANQVTQRIRPRLEEELFETFEHLVPNPLFRWVITRGSNLVGMGMHPYIRREDQLEIRAGDLSDRDPYWLQGPPYTRKIYYHAIHDLGQMLVDTPLLACTGFMAGPGSTRDGHWLLARNFDSEIGVSFDRDKLVRVHIPDKGIPYASVGFAGLAGAVSGVNRAGIAVAINASASDDPPRLGTPMTLIVREILESASTLDEAEAILRRRNGFLSENVLVVDADHNQAALFEVTPSRLARLPVTGSLGVTNHFRSPEFTGDRTTAHRIASSTTAQRLARMEELLQQRDGELDLEVAIDLLSDRRGIGGRRLPRAHRQALNADIATHGVVIDATTRTLRISRFPNLAGGWVELDLEEVIAGRLDTLKIRDPIPGGARAIEIRQARMDWLRRARRAGLPEALDLTERALTVLPDHPEALEARGWALRAAGRDAEAREMFQRALDAPPEYPHQVEVLREALQ